MIGWDYAAADSRALTAMVSRPPGDWGAMRFQRRGAAEFRHDQQGAVLEEDDVRAVFG